MTVRPSVRFLQLAALLGVALTSQAAAQSTPTVDDILDRFVEAQGGEEAVLMHDSQEWTGTFKVPAAGLSGTLQLKLMAPNFQHVKIEAPGLGTISEGHSDGVSWQDSFQTGPRVLEGAEAELSRISADYRGTLAFKENFATVESLGAEDFEGQTCWKIQTVTEMGTEMMHFFSQDTGLLTGTSGEVPTQMGQLSVTTTVSEWVEYGGVLFPTVTTQKVMGAQQVLELESVTFDSLSTEDFALPPAIKAIAEAAGAAEDQG